MLDQQLSSLNLRKVVKIAGGKKDFVKYITPEKGQQSPLFTSLFSSITQLSRQDQGFFDLKIDGHGVGLDQKVML